MNDSHSTIFRSAKRFFSGTVLSRISGMLRDMAMAYVFGTQASIASFMLAFRFSHLLRRLFGEGALQSAFVPEFESLRHEDEQRAFVFFRDLNIVLTLFLSILILFGCGGLALALTYGHLSEGNQEIIYLTLLMLPSLLFICLYGLNASLLQCEKSYFTPGVAPVAFNGIWIIAVFALRHMEEKEAMPWLAFGVIVACFFQWIFTVPKTLSIMRKQFCFPLWKDIRFYSQDLIQLGHPLFLGIVGVAASQVNNAVDAVFARFADPEGPALLWYAIRVQQLPLALFGVAISSAILPPLSRAIKTVDWEKYQHFLNYACRQTINLMIPVTFFLFVAGDTCLNFIYGRGDFSSSSIAGTTWCLWAYSLGLFPTALILILAPAYYAQSNYRLPAIASFLSMGLNGVLNTWMILVLGFGAVSVAIATSLSAWINVIFLGGAMIRRKEMKIESGIAWHFGRVCFYSFLASLPILGLRMFLLDSSFFHLIQGESASFSRQFADQLIQVTWQGGLFFLSISLLLFGRRILFLTQQLTNNSLSKRSR